MDRDSIQILVDQTPPGETLKLVPGEYQGPLAISKSITLEGCIQDGKIRTTIWGQQGPVISITSEDARLHNLNVEVTMQNGDSKDDSDVAIKSELGIQVELDNVTVRGRLVGLDGEAGDWLLPRSLDLGFLAARKLNSYSLRLYVPVPCQVSTKISGLAIKPVALQQGLNDISLEVKDLCKDCFINGTILVRSAFVYRSIEITGRTPSGDDVAPIAGVLLWEPKDIPTPKPEPAELPRLVVEESPPASLPTMVTQGVDVDAGRVDLGDASTKTQTTLSPDTSDEMSQPGSDEEASAGVSSDTETQEPSASSVPVVISHPQSRPTDTKADDPAPIKAKGPSVYRRTGGNVSAVFQSPGSSSQSPSPAHPDPGEEVTAPVSEVTRGTETKAGSFQRTSMASPLPKTPSIPNPALFGGKRDDAIPQDKPGNAEDNVQATPVQPTTSVPTKSRRTKSARISSVFGSNAQPDEDVKAPTSTSLSPPDTEEAADGKPECRSSDDEMKKGVEPAKDKPAKKPATELGGAFK